MVNKYGRSVIFGNLLLLKISTGICPSNSGNSNSAAWEKRERLASTKMTSFSYTRVKAKTFALAGAKKWIFPRPKALNCLRVLMILFIHHNREEGFICCASTLMDSYL